MLKLNEDALTEQPVVAWIKEQKRKVEKMIDSASSLQVEKGGGE